MLGDETLYCCLTLATELKIAPFRRRFVNFAKNPSTALSHDDEVGVKWNVQLLCAISQARTSPVLCVP